MEEFMATPLAAFIVTGLLGAIGTVSVARRALVEGVVGHLMSAAVVVVFFCVPFLFLSGSPISRSWPLAAGVVTGAISVTAPSLARISKRRRQGIGRGT